MDSRTISRSPRAFGEVDEIGSGLSVALEGGWTLYRNVTVSRGRQVIGISRGLKSSTRPSEAREILAWLSRTLKVAKGVTSKSRLAIMGGRGEPVFMREQRMRAETAGLTGKRFIG